MLQKGISEDQLIQRCDWITKKLQERGLRIGTVSKFSNQISVKEALRHLKKQVSRKRDMFGPQVQPKYEHLTYQLLAYCRNGIVNQIQSEIIMGCVLFSFGHQMACTEGINEFRAKEEFFFLYRLLSFEFNQLNKLNQDLFTNTIQQMRKFNVIQINQQNNILVKDDLFVSYLCSLCWPFVESYWVTIAYLYQFKKNLPLLTQDKLSQQIQWYAESLGEERILEHLESLSQDSIANSLKQYIQMEILKKNPNNQLELVCQEENIQELEQHLQKLMKHSFSKTLSIPINLSRKNNLIDFPFISKL